MLILQRAILCGLLALAATPVGAADSLGRLFMTPDQRRALDAQREPGSDVLPDAAPGATVAPPPESQVLVNGIVRRSRGPDVVWVNGVRADANSAQIRVQRGPDKASRVTLKDAAEGQTVRLKPGQYWERATGRVADCYGCGKSTPPAGNPVPPAEATADKP